MSVILVHTTNRQTMRHPALTQTLHAIRLGALITTIGYIPALYTGALLQTLWHTIT